MIKKLRMIDHFYEYLSKTPIEKNKISQNYMGNYLKSHRNKTQI